MPPETPGSAGQDRITDSAARLRAAYLEARERGSGPGVLRSSITIEDNLDWHRRTYGVPARVGGRVIADGRGGVIVGKSGPHLLVLIDGDGAPTAWHPTWRMEYLDAD